MHTQIRTNKDGFGIGDFEEEGVSDSGDERLPEINVSRKNC